MIRRRSAGVPQNTSLPVGLGEKKSSSTSKIRDMFRAAPPTLEEALADFESAGKLTMKLADVQKRGATRFSQWAKAGGNSAIDDVASRMRELMVIYAEQQSQLAEEMVKNADNLRKMAEVEEGVKEAEKKLILLIEKEKRLEKEMHRLKHPGMFSRTKPDAGIIRSHLRELLTVIQDREKAEIQLKSIRSEAEVAKMFHFRKGMKGFADSFCNYSTNTANIFQCHRELTELVPAIATEDVQYLKYEGMPISRRKVDQVRRSIEPPCSPSSPSDSPCYPESHLLSRPEHRRRSEPLRMGSGWERRDCQGTPPPPYSPSRNGRS